MILASKRWHSGEESHTGIKENRGQPSGRGCIAGFSPQSRTRLRRYLENTPHRYCVLITLTYAGIPACGATCKRDMDAFIRQLRMHQVMPESMVWIMEFQRRGALHFHLLSTHYVPKWAISWCWHFASANPPVTSTNVTAIRVPVRYALKYARKLIQKVPPAGFERMGRFWGIYGCRCRYVLEATHDVVAHEDVWACLRLKEIEAQGKAIYRHKRGFVAFEREEKRG